MAARLDLQGQRFSRLTALRPAHYDERQKKLNWECRCECGKIVYVHTNSLTCGNTKSCGCWDKEVAGTRLRGNTYGLRHGHATRDGFSLEYNVWQGMIQRCLNPNAPRYAEWGGRGITVCDRWRDFAKFLEDMGPRPSLDYSLDRIDNDGPYEALNCRWATRSQQQRNRRDRQ